MPKKNGNQWTSVRAKIKKENYLEVEKFCSANDITISSYIRSLIESNNPSEASLSKAGLVNFRFNPLEDRFAFEVKYDDGTINQIGDGLSKEFLEQLKIAIDKAIKHRNESVHQRLNGSNVIPNLKKLKGGGDNVKA